MRLAESRMHEALTRPLLKNPAFATVSKLINTKGGEAGKEKLGNIGWWGKWLNELKARLIGFRPGIG